jgi:hypothetical protein
MERVPRGEDFVVAPLGTLRSERMVSPAPVGAQLCSAQACPVKGHARLVLSSQRLQRAASPSPIQTERYVFGDNDGNKHRRARISYSAVHSFTE